MAGLGGDSSDAAALLRGLNELWGLGLSPEKLQQIAAQLGSDVAFFLHGGTALAEGRGEIITPLPALTENVGGAGGAGYPRRAGQNGADVCVTEARAISPMDDNAKAGKNFT